MPRVPSAQRTEILRAPRQRTFVPESRLTQEGAGGAVARGVDRVARALGDTMQRISLENDALATQAELNRAGDEVRQLLSGPEGLLNTVGENAIGITGGANDSLEQIRGRAVERLTSVDQIRLFDDQFERRRAAVLDSLSRHESRERRRWDGEVKAAQVSGAVQDAVDAPFSPETVASAIEAGSGAIDAYGMRYGLPPEVIDQERTEFVSGLHEAAIGSLSQTDPVAAASYLAELDDQLTPDTLARVNRTLEPMLVRAEAQARTEQVLATPGGESEHLELARSSIADPKVRDDVVARIRTRHAEARRIEAEAQRGRDEAALLAVRELPNPSAFEIPPGVSDKAAASIRDYQRRAAGGERITTDLEAWAEAEDLRTNDARRAEFEGSNLLERFHGRLSTGDLQKLISDQAHARSGSGKYEERIQARRTPNQVASDQVKQFGLGNVRGAQFRRRFFEEVDAAEDAAGKRLTSTELYSIADGLLRVVEDGFFSDTYAFEIDPPGGATVSTGGSPQVPSRHAEAIRRQFEAVRGRPPTEAEVLAAYQAATGGVGR